MQLTRKGTSESPWGAYEAWVDDIQVGECAFKSAPVRGSVEIAYNTYEPFQGRGHATQMARELVALARQMDAALVITAQTLCETNASTAILRKLGFVLHGTVEHPEDGPVWEWRLRPRP